MYTNRRLIGLVEKFSNISDKSNPDFKSAIFKENSWKIIAANLDSTPKECVNRWVMLRTRYAREKQELKSATYSGAGAVRRTPWLLAGAMGFVDKFVVPRKTTGNVLSGMTSPHISSAPQESVWDTQIILEDEPMTAAGGSSQDDFSEAGGSGPVGGSSPTGEGELAGGSSPEGGSGRAGGSGPTGGSSTPGGSGTPGSSTPLLLEGLGAASPVPSTSGAVDPHGLEPPLQKRRRVQLDEEDQRFKETLFKIGMFFDRNQATREQPLEMHDQEYSFGRTLALMLKSIENPRHRRILETELLTRVANYEPESD